MKYLVLVSMLAVAMPAYAGTVQLTVTTAAGSQSVTLSIADADLARILAAQKIFATSGSKAGGVPPTNAAILQGMAKEMAQQWVSHTLSYEKSKMPVASIPVTPQ